jgi:rhodanese-related sulfurtransferase
MLKRMKSILILLPLFILSCTPSTKVDHTINGHKLLSIISAKDFSGVILDVRTPAEWKKSGIINKAVTYNAYDKNLKSYIKSLNKTKTYYVYCHSGVRSAKVFRLLQEHGINSFNVEGGIAGWMAAKYPLVKYEEQE